MGWLQTVKDVAELVQKADNVRRQPGFPSERSRIGWA